MEVIERHHIADVRALCVLTHVHVFFLLQRVALSLFRSSRALSLLRSGADVKILMQRTDKKTNEDLYTLFFYKNILYKNIEAENPRKSKNILRIIRGSYQVGSNNSCKKAQYN